MFFLSPADVKDTGFLTYDYDEEGRDDDQWLYLPALKKTKRIASGDKSGSFMGSDFTYADMTDRLIPYWLCSGDRGTMGIPLEFRAPFLDRAVGEYLAALPSSLKLTRSESKAVLRRAFARDWPPSVRRRGKQTGRCSIGVGGSPGHPLSACLWPSCPYPGK